MINAAIPATTMEAVRYEPVDRCSGLSVREFKKQYYNRRPVVMTDGIKDWGARSTWTFDNFKSRYGKSIVSAYPYENGSYRADREQRMPLADYIGKILLYDFDSYPYYLIYNASLLQEHIELWADFSEPKYCFDWFKFIPEFMRFPSPRLYLGPKGAISTLHQDRWGTHFWMAQLEGRKRWILFSPDQAELLYSTKVTGDLIRYQVQPEKPDLERFPLFKKTKGVECTIGPGDLLIVPGNWLHWVISLDPTLSLTHNYMGPGNFSPCLKGQTGWFLDYCRGILKRRFKH
jgi:ribosomal protein L16 Arg81 hydroxylase